MKKFNFKLGIQYGTEPSVNIPSYGNKVYGLRSVQSEKAFPDPKGHSVGIALSVGLAFYCVFVTFLVIYYFIFSDPVANRVSIWTVVFMPLAFVTPVVFLQLFLFPVLDRYCARKGKHIAQGVVLAVDQGGVVVNDDAQQRALIKVIYEGNHYIFVANQFGLYLNRGSSVKVSWNAINSELCYVHEYLK